MKQLTYATLIKMTSYPNTIYRVSVKALIKNEKGEILVLKENQGTWSLPGGGLDHGEVPEVGMGRELIEELGLQKIHSIKPVCIKTFYLEPMQTWLMWVVYDVVITQQEFTLGEGVTAAKFIPPDTLKNSTDVFEQMVYEVSKG